MKKFVVSHPESNLVHGRIQSGGGGGGGAGKLDPPPTEISQVAIGFLRNSGTDPLREAIGSLGSNC